VSKPFTYAKPLLIDGKALFSRKNKPNCFSALRTSIRQVGCFSAVR